MHMLFSIMSAMLEGIHGNVSHARGGKMRMLFSMVMSAMLEALLGNMRMLFSIV